MENELNKKLAQCYDPIVSLMLSVITIDLKTLRKLKQKSDYTNTLRTFCLDLLLNRLISKGDILNFSTRKLSRAYGIHCIIVDDCQIKENMLTGEVVASTSISISSLHSKEFYLRKQNLLAKDVCLAGLRVEVDRLCNLIRLQKTQRGRNSTGVLLHGPPGCGKSLLAQYVAKTCDAVLVSVEAAQLLKAEYGAGAQELKRIFNEAKALTDEGTVIVSLDDLDTLCPNLPGASLGIQQMASALMSEFDVLNEEKESKLLVIGATKSISSIAKALRRPGRFDQELLINVPTHEQRLSILQMMLQRYKVSSSVDLPSVALRTAGFVGADLKALFEEAENSAFCKQSGKEIDAAIEMKDFDRALHFVKPSLRKGLDCSVELPNVRWEDIGGLDDIKQEIKQSIEWPLLHRDALRRMDLTPTKGILLFGPPGCCKTTLVKAAASSCHVNFLSLTSAQVFSAYVGQSEKTISEVFQKARALSPCILFFDEIESMVGKRLLQGAHNHVQERILATLLNEMDGVGVRLDKKTDVHSAQVKECQEWDTQYEETSQERVFLPNSGQKKSANQSQVIVVGATNRPDMVDGALTRPGRLDKLIYVPPPDVQARRSILDVYTSTMSTDNVDLSTLAETTHNYSGADLKNLCKEAGLCVLREVLAQERERMSTPKIQDKHFQVALATVQPSLTPDVLKLYQ